MSRKKQRARKSPDKQKAKNQNKIEKFLVKSNVENKEVNSNNDQELQLKIKDLKFKIRELLKEKRELECLTFPKPYKLKDIPLNYDAAKFADTSYGTHTAKFRLKFHEFVGCVVSKVDEKRLVIKFHVFEVNKVHVYGIKFNSEDNQEAQGMDYTFSKCFVPPMIKINELLKQYPVLDDPKPLIRVLATACQVFHDIQIQIDQFKEKSDPKYVTIFNSLNNRVIELSFQMVQRSTESVFPVSVELPYNIYKPRPIEIFINSKEMPRSTLKEFKKHCKNFYRFSIWNAFEIITNMGLKQHESVFYLLQGQSELAELNTDKPTILIKKKAKVVEQILHDFTFDTNDEDASVQKNNLDSSLNESNVEIGKQSIKSSCKKITEQSKFEGSDLVTSVTSSFENTNQKSSSTAGKSDKSEKSPHVNSIDPQLHELDTRIKRRLETSFNNRQQTNSNYTRKITKIIAKNKSHEIINPELTGNKVVNPKNNLEGKNANSHLKNISESERSPESKRSKVKRSLEQTFTHAETNYEESSSKIQVKDKTPESVCSSSTVFDSEKCQELKKSLHSKNISESERSPESKRSRVQRSLEQLFSNAETSYEENSSKIQMKDKTPESVCSCSTVLDSELKKSLHLKNISESERSPKSKRSRVQRSLEQAFTNAETSYEENSSKIQTKVTPHESVCSYSTVTGSEKEEVEQILRDLTLMNLNDEDASAQTDDFDSSLDESNVEISKQSIKSSRKKITEQSKVEGSDLAAKSSVPKKNKQSNKESEKSSKENITQRNTENSKTKLNEQSVTSSFENTNQMNSTFYDQYKSFLRLKKKIRV